MRKNIFRFSFKEHLSLFLVFCLLISQTIHVSFFERTEAAADDYRDLVSIVVDRATYNKLSSKIKRYSEDIQWYLWDTRVSLFVVPDDAPPEAIAAQNEKLYYEGDGGESITNLVGTILIGNVPIPVVHRGADSFPSLYPYVDFDEKRFVYNQRSHTYQYAPDAREDTDVEIWHGVINPSVGRAWNEKADIQKIGEFLDKTHDFYTKSGKFQPTTFAPRVFYYDGYNESAAISPKNVFQYGLFMENVENFAYKRFTKHLLSDIADAVEKYDSQNADTELNEYIASLWIGTGSTALSGELIAPLPDIQTNPVIASYVKRFYEILNQKTLSDEQLFVHNAGRYTSGSMVRVDQPTIQGALMDEVSISILKEANTALENAIDQQITASGYARKAVIFDKIAYTLSNGVSSDGTNTPVWYSKEYNGYMFWKKSSEITLPEQCTIARWFSGTDADYGKSIRVEANAAFDINSTESHVELLKDDTEELVGIHKSAAYSCFDSSSGNPKIASYWGGNSILRVAGGVADDVTNVLNIGINSQTGKFSLPIFSLQGMKETTRLKNPSLADCDVDNYQYALLAPYTYTISDPISLASQTVKWPTEWNRTSKTPRYTCLTQHDVLPSVPSLAKSFEDYDARTCFVGNVYVDGASEKALNHLCYLDESGVIYSSLASIPLTSSGYSDITHYENRYYHTVPSLWKHISPEEKEIAAAKENGVTPSLPVDIKRSVEFLTAKGNIARFEYPDFFQSPGKDVATVRAWLKTLSDQQWNAVITKENATTLSSYEQEVQSALPATAIPSSPLDWNDLISDEVIEKIIQSQNWLHPDITQKNKNVVESSLSYSHRYGSDITKNVPSLPEIGSGYDIAYLGLTSLAPLWESEASDTLDREYTTQLAEIQALNMGNDGVAWPGSDYQSSAKCGPPEWVMIFQWPSAIMCWIASLFPPRIGGGSCGGSTVGASEGDRPSTSAPKDIQNDPTKLKVYYNSAKLIYDIEKKVLTPSESIAVKFDFITPDNSHIELPLGTTVGLEIVSLQSSGKTVDSQEFQKYLEIAPSQSPYTIEGWVFALLSHDQLAQATLRAILSIPLPDGTKYTTVSSDLQIRVSDEYIDITPSVDGTDVSTIDTTLSGSVMLQFAPKDASGSMLSENLPYILDVYDAFDDTLIESGITIQNNTYPLSLNYTKKIGSYRFIVRDSVGRYGEVSLTVRSGPLARATITPVSSALVVGSDSLGILRLIDKLGNILSPELHNIVLTAEWGYLIDSEGKHVSEIQMDSIDNELILSYGSTGAGKMRISVSIDGTIQTSTSIDIYPSARVVLERSARPVVASSPITVRLKVLDNDGNIISGFSSVAEIALSETAWYFASGTIAKIENGKSEELVFYPGRVSGDHTLSLSIPWLGNIQDIIFGVDPGSPMYMTSSYSDDAFGFIIRDRYGNISPVNFSGSIVRDKEDPRSVVFTGGIFTDTRKSGYYTMRVPQIAKNTVSYTDPSGTYYLTGISHASLYVPPVGTDFSFLPDYNARYTVLAGDAFLRQWEDILYDVTPGASSSLAVSTLLDSPYQKNTLLSVFPGWGFSLGSAIDTAITSEITLQNNALVLTVRDDVTHTEVGRVGYPLLGAGVSACTETSSSLNSCDEYFDTPHVRVVSWTGSSYTSQVTWENVALVKDTQKLVQYSRTNGFQIAAGVTLVPDVSASKMYLVLSVQYDGQVVWKVIVAMNQGSNVARSSSLTTPQGSSPILFVGESSSYQITQAYVSEFSSEVHGYSIVAPNNTRTLDNNRIGPNNRDSLGALSELPGVGWRGQNRLLLSYSAGDTVWEASRWFHTYTAVNLGDPVAHIDHGAPGTQKEGIDRTIGTQIASSAHGSIQSYLHKDMNHDGYEDIVIFYTDGFVELLLNINGKFRSRKMIASIPDSGVRKVAVGDFTADGYSDIIATNASGTLILLDNDQRKITRIDISTSDTMSVKPPSGITQFEIFDMDNDTRDDIVYISEDGELGILYGTAQKWRFQQKILDKTLTISLSDESTVSGGAITASTVPQLELLNTPSTATGVDDTILKAEVFYQKAPSITQASSSLTGSDVLVLDVSSMTGVIANTLTDPNTTPTTSTSSIVTYVKNEYAGAYGIDVSKSFHTLSGATLKSGTPVTVDIAIKNTSSGVLQNIEYLDTIPAIFDAENTLTYKVVLWTQSEEKTFVMTRDTYDVALSVRDIPAGATVHILYDVEALPATYGKMIVGKLESWEVGDDVYGDVGFESSTTCGADMVLWRSITSREYERWTRSYSSVDLPDSIASRLTDADKNDVPDSVENMSAQERKDAYSDISDNNGGTLSSDSSSLIHAEMGSDGGVMNIGISDQSAAELNTIMKNLADGMSCGFGWGSCMSFPVNWAPLAPGSDPSVFGNPKGDGLKVDEWLPLLSALTCMPITITCGTSPCTLGIPTVWPASILRADSFSLVGGANNPKACWVGSFTNGAGGMLGVDAKANFLRIFVTPTLTLGMGTAICMGGPAKTFGKNPGKWLYPLISGGNCIVITKPMSLCKWDGSADDGDIRGLSGLGTIRNTWNAESCSLEQRVQSDSQDSKEFYSSVVDYLKSKDTTRLNNIYTALSKRWGSRNISGGPAIRIGSGGPSDGQISVEIDTSKPFNIGNIVKTKNIRVAGFPDFIMDWVARQTDEIGNKLFALPNLIIIPPTDLGPNAQVDGSIGSYGKLFSQAADKASVSELKSQMAWAFNNTNAASSLSAKARSNSSLSSGYKNWLDNKVQENSSTINTVAGSANALKAAYKFIGQIPFLRIRQSSVAFNVPWPLPQELDKYARSLEQYKNEINNMKRKWCNGNPDGACLDSKTSLNTSTFVASIEKNLRMIDMYRKFPEKLQQYVTWRQRYTAWAMCNIESIQQFTGKWIRENGVRFQKWAEFYVLMKAIAGSWQPVIDVFRTGNAQCAVCQNQRYTLDYFKFKAISAFVPSIPIIQFPKWPDIVLDLSDVRFAITIDVPDYKFNVTPLRLPNLPTLALPGSPTLSLGLPALPTLPSLPNLPSFPELPSLPKISFPPLPPPPKLPKMFWAVTVVTNLVKLYQMIKCYYQKSTLVPEWQAGDVIAQRTSRQGTLPIDFLNLQFPQFSMPSLREIRVQSHVNFELQSDFITSFARATAKPFNSFNTDLSRSIPSKIGEDISIQSQQNININAPKIQSRLDGTGMTIAQAIAQFQYGNNILMDVDEFIPYFRSELVRSGQSTQSLDRALEKTRIETRKVIQEMEEHNATQERLLKEYIEAEEAKTKTLEKLIDKMKHPDTLLVQDSIGIASFVSEENDIAQEKLALYNEFIASSQMDSLMEDTAILASEHQAFRARTSRLLAAASLAPVTPESGGYGTDGYSPKFEGIYIVTPKGVQTRLFDYIEPLQGEETVETLDLDKDGDIDYLYLMDGALFFKQSHIAEPARQNDDTLTILDLDPDMRPEAPNFFQELFASPSQIALEFTPAHQDKNNYRLEFFDRYAEWDLHQIGVHDEEEIPRTVVDILIEDTSKDTEANSIEVHPMERSLHAVSGADGFQVEWPAITPLLPDTNFTLTAYRPLYTGKKSTKLVYSLWSSGTTQEILLKPYSRYLFWDTLSGSITSGKIFFFDMMSTEKYGYSSDIIGMPILDEMKITNLDGSFTIRDNLEESLVKIESGGQYRMVSFPSRDSSYVVSLPYENGFYSARMRSSDSETNAGVALFAPQASLDHGSPIVDLDDRIRVPVYKSISYQLSDFITDVSPYTVSIDPDLTQDENQNGIYDDDFWTGNTHTQLTDTNLIIGPYSDVWTRTMNLRVVDAYGNQTLSQVSIEVYAPTPQIQSISATGIVIGGVDDQEEGEPVHFFRVRWGSPITLLSTGSTLSATGGWFMTGTIFSGTGVRLSYSGGSVLMDESTGLPTGNGVILSVLPASATSPMKFQYRNTASELLFEQFLSLPTSTSIVSSASGQSLPYVLMHPEQGYRTELATLKDPSIPGGAYLVDERLQPLAALASDGNIYLLSSELSLSATNENGYLSIHIQKNGTVIATVLYKVNFFYTVK